ncbi:FUSC family protein [Xanthomonas bundabergensis]|uniref:FUSC family protein n=1 Tax=Xanthomonas bundabergensis TaxID=3160842 RepID=UPI003515ECDF
MDGSIAWALRMTVAALLALALAASLDIRHPWWAAMTVWLVAQPTRGLLLERGVARLAGTALGAIAGAWILHAFAADPVSLLVAIALWLALCAGVGSLFRHFRNYGLVLAGYTAAIVALFGFDDGAFDAGLALDRVACTVLGIACVGLASLPGMTVARGARAATRLDAVVRRCLCRVETHLRGAEAAPAGPAIAAIQALDRAVDSDVAGSLGGRGVALRARRVAGLLLELIALTLRPAASACILPAMPKHADARLAMLAGHALAAGQPALAQVLHELRQALRAPATAFLGEFLQDVDLAAMLRASLRPVLALAIAAALWWGTGWQTGAMMAMTAALFASLFSSNDQGNQALLQVLVGSLLGAVAGVGARLLVLPQAGGVLPVLLCIAPFLLLGAWLMRRPATAKMAIDLTLTFLLTAQPGAPPVPAAVALQQAAAIVAGVLVAVATFWLILPATPAARWRRLRRRIARLGLRLQRAPDGAAAARAHRRLRAARVQLLLACSGPCAAQAEALHGLARSRRALSGRTRAEPARPLPTTGNDAAASHAERVPTSTKDKLHAP